MNHMRQPPFANDCFYHVYNRGVDKRTIFESDRDFERFLMALYLFNDTTRVDYDLARLDLRGLTSYQRTPLVDILQWSLLPNHFHLLLRQRVENGISLFMQKVGTGYTLYFNRKHERSGRLFQGTYKSKLVPYDGYFKRLAAYVPLNPLELFYPEWETKGIPRQELKQAKQTLQNYQWTSFNDYLFEDVIPHLTEKSAFLKAFDGSLGDFENYLDREMNLGISLRHEVKPRRLILEKKGPRVAL